MGEFGGVDEVVGALSVEVCGFVEVVLEVADEGLFGVWGQCRGRTPGMIWNMNRLRAAQWSHEEGSWLLGGCMA